MIAPYLIYCATVIAVTASEPLSYWEMLVSGKHIIRVTSEVPVTRVDLSMTDLAGNVGTAGWTPEPLPTPVDLTPTPEPLMYWDGYGTWYGIAPVRLPATTYAISYLPDCGTPTSLAYYLYASTEDRWRFSKPWTGQYPFTTLLDATGLEGPVWLGNYISCSTGSTWNLRAMEPEFLEYPTATFNFTRIPTKELTPTWTQTSTPSASLTMTPTLSTTPEPQPTEHFTSTRSPTASASASPSPSATPKPTWTPYLVRLRLRGIEYRDGWMELILEPRRNQ